MARSTGTTVIGVLSILFGALAVVLSLFSLLGAVAAAATMGQVSPSGMPVHTAARIGPLLFSALFLGLSAAQLVGGIGALMLRPWARALLRIAAIGALTLLILGLVGSIFSLIAVLSGGEVGMISIAVLIPLVLVIAGLVYNGLVLWWFNTPTARAEFQVGGAAPAPAVSSTICPSCSKVNHSDAQFCYHCGQALTWDKPAATK